MGVSCNSTDTAEEKEYYRSLGLVSNHAYSILDVREIEGNRLSKHYSYI